MTSLSQTNARLKTVLRMFRFRSVLVKILSVLLILLFVSCGTIAFILKDRYNESATETAIGNGFTLMNYGCVQLDSALTELNIKVNEILELPSVGNALISKGITANPAILEVTSRFYKLTRENPVVRRIDLFLPEEGVVLTSDQTAESLSGHEKKPLLEKLEKELSGAEESVITFIEGRFYLASTFPRGKAIAFLAITLNTEELYKTWSTINSNMPENLKAYVYINEIPFFEDQEGYPGREELLVTEKSARSPLDTLYKTTDSHRLLMSHTSLGWKIQTVGIVNTESERLLAKGILSNHVPLWLLLIALWGFAGIVLVLIVYPPLLRLLNSTVSGTGDKPESAGNEYDVIEQFFTEQKNRQQKLNTLLRDSGEAVTQTLFTNLLRGEPVDAETVEMVFSGTQSGFSTNSLFGLILVDFSGKDGQPIQERDKMEGELICVPFFTRFFKDKCAICLLGQNNRVLAVLGFSEEISPEEATHYLSECEKRLIEETQKSNMIPVSASAALRRNVFELPDAFEEARTVLQEKMYYGRSKNADGIPEAETLLHQALEFILRSPDEGKKHLLELIGSFDVAPQAMTLYRMTVDNLLAFFVRCRIPTEAHWSRLHTKIEKVQTKDEFAAEKEELQAFFQEAADRIVQAATSVQIQYLETAKNFIRGHFSDSLLSLSEVSDSCGIGSSYLSHLFTTYSGQSFTDYLNGYRIRRACEMLNGTSLSISEIGFKAGFNSPQNFNRVFKKYMEVTPSHYRSDRAKEKERQ